MACAKQSLFKIKYKNIKLDLILQLEKFAYIGGPAEIVKTFLESDAHSGCDGCVRSMAEDNSFGPGITGNADSSVGRLVY